MTPMTAGRVVAAMANIWPSMTVADQTVEAWAACTPELDEQVCLDAVRRLAQSDDFPPSIHRFMQTVRSLTRQAAQPAIATGPVSHSDRRQAQERVRALRGYWRAAAVGRPAHDHRGGDDGCPRCSTSDEWIAEHAPGALEVLRSEVPL